MKSQPHQIAHNLMRKYPEDLEVRLLVKHLEGIERQRIEVSGGVQVGVIYEKVSFVPPESDDEDFL